MEKDIKYIILEKHDILNGIKYKVGKRYKLDKFNGIEIYGNVSDINFLSYSFRWSIENVDIYEIGAYQTLERIDMYEDTDRVLYATDFKILKKINYKEINIKNKNSEIIFGFKNRDEKILDKILKFAKEDCYKSGFQLASLGIEKYLKELRKIDREGTVYGLINLGRNKDLDRFIESDNNNILCKIADIGRPQDLNELINYISNILISRVLKNKRYKDIDKIIKKGYSNQYIIDTGVDKYLDIYIKNKDDFCIPFFTEDVIFRKKDLDIILSLNRKNDRVIADYGFDEHLDYLSKHSEDEYCLESILQFHRKCDYDMIKKRGYKIDDDVCDKNLLW